MRPHPTIDELRRRKSLNVSQQVAITRDDIRREAVWWRRNPIRAAVRDVFTARGIDTNAGIFVSVSDREYEQDCVFGIFVTSDERFIEFDIELSPDGESTLEVSVFNDVTAQQDICGHKPGIGATRSFLVLDVLKELNHSPQSDCETEDTGK